MLQAVPLPSICRVPTVRTKLPIYWFSHIIRVEKVEIRAKFRRFLGKNRPFSHIFRARFARVFAKNRRIFATVTSHQLVCMHAHARAAAVIVEKHHDHDLNHAVCIHYIYI